MTQSSRQKWFMLSAVVATLLIAALAISGTAPKSSAKPSVLFEENFSKKQDSNGVPAGWQLKQWAGGNPSIRLGSENGSTVLHLTSEGNSFGIYKEFKFNVQKYPILHWRWKVTKLPKGGDVRKKETDDQAAQVYVSFPISMIKTNVLGYIWENNTPKNLKVPSQKSSHTRYIVLESGTEKVGQWVEEKRNVYEDYKALFGEAPPTAGGVALMIDSDDTHSRAESFFDDIRIEKTKAAP